MLNPRKLAKAKRRAEKRVEQIRSERDYQTIQGPWAIEEVKAGLEKLAHVSRSVNII